MRPSPTEPDKPMAAATERRSSTRVMVQLDTTIDDGKMARMYQTQNLSSSGMLVRTQKPFPVGTRVAVQFLFPGNPQIPRDALPGGYGFVEGEAIVVRHTHPVKEAINGMALHFTDLESRGRRLLAEFLGGRQDDGPVGSPA